MGIFGFPLQRAFNGDCRRDYARLRASPGAAEIYGKVATFVFYAVMVLVIAFGPEIGALRAWFTLPTPAMVVLVILSAVLTVVALLSYAPATFRQFKEKSKTLPLRKIQRNNYP